CVTFGARQPSCVAVATPQLHRHTDDVVALLEQQCARDRGIDPAAHGEQDLHQTSSRRSCVTLSATTSTARSTSASVVVWPSDIRNAPCAREVGTPIASSTCDGSIAPLAHADAALAQTSPSCSRNSSDSLSIPSKHFCTDPGTLGSRALVSVAPFTR